MRKIIISLIFSGFVFALNIPLAYYKSYNYEKMGDYKDAIKVLIPIFKEYPKGYTINLRLGHLFFLDKKYNNSIEHYTKASTILPASVEPKLGLIRNYLQMGKYDSALSLSNSIIKRDFYNYYGNYYLLLGLKYKKYKKEAKDVAKKMLALYPTNVLYLQELAKLEYESNKQKAIKLFRDILILDPNNVVAKEYLAK